MAIYKLQDLLTQHGVTEDQVTTFGSEESINNDLMRMLNILKSRKRSNFDKNNSLPSYVL